MQTKVWHQSDVTAQYFWINSSHSPDHFWEAKCSTLKACKIITFNARRLKLWNRVFDKVNFKSKQKQITLHRHFNADDFARNYALITDKQAQSVPYLVRDSFVFTAYQTVHAGEQEDEQPLSDRDKRMITFLGFVRTLRWPSFLLGIFLTILHQPVARRHKQYRRHLNRSRFLAIDLRHGMNALRLQVRI